MSPIYPGHPMLVPEMTPWLTDTVTIEQPVGPGWTVSATDLAARVIENQTRIDPQTLLRVQQTVLYVPHGTDIASGYRVTRASDGQRWTADIPRDWAEAPMVEVPLKGAR